MAWKGFQSLKSVIMKLKNNVSFTKKGFLNLIAELSKCLKHISAGKKLLTAEGAESSDEEGGSSAKKLKTSQPPVPETSSANASSMGSIPMAPMLGSPFMSMGPMSHYVGHIPMMGAMPQMQLPGGQLSSPQSAPKPLFPTPSSSTPSINSASKPAFAAYR